MGGTQRGNGVERAGVFWAVAAAARTDRIAGEHAAAFLLRLRRLGQLRLRRQFAWRQNGAVVLRRSPRSRQKQRGEVTWRVAPSNRFVLQRSRGVLLDREPCE